jgi:thymidylate synthase
MNSLDAQYQDLLQAILDFGVEKKDRTGTGTKSIFGYTFRHKMSWGFPLLTTKKMAWKTMVTELLWFLRGDTNIKFLVDNNCHIWDGDAFKNFMTKSEGDPDMIWNQDQFIHLIKTNDEFAKEWGELGPIYGAQWRYWQGELDQWDQIKDLISELKTNPDSRRLMVNSWNVGQLHEMVLPPCHYGFQVYTRELTWEEQVEWVMKNTNVELENVYIVEEVAKETTPKRAISLMWNQRSVDTFLGLPFNIASYGLLLEIIAKMVNMVPDELIGNLGDTHLYLNHVEQAEEQIQRTSFDLLPTLNINTEFWPTESGECGVGPLDATAVLNSFKDDNFCKCLLEEDLQLLNYQSHPAIKAPLSN